MKLKTIQPGPKSFSALQASVNNGETVFRSPHVGNINKAELALMFGIDAMGGRLELSLVDTIRGDDRYADPRSLLLGGSKIALASRNYAKSRVVAACEIDEAGIKNLQNSALSLLPPVSNLASLHNAALERAVPESLKVQTASAFFGTIDLEMYRTVLDTARTILSRNLRSATESGKIVEVPMEAPIRELFGRGENPLYGAMPPLEAMLAMECIKAVTVQPSEDVRIVHVGGPDMVRYVADKRVMEPARMIGELSLKRMGRPTNVTVEYVVPCLQTTVDDKQFPRLLDRFIGSQYDILAEQREVATI